MNNQSINYGAKKRKVEFASNYGGPTKLGTCALSEIHLSPPGLTRNHLLDGQTVASDVLTIVADIKSPTAATMAKIANTSLATRSSHLKQLMIFGKILCQIIQNADIYNHSLEYLLNGRITYRTVKWILQLIFKVLLPTTM